MMTREFETKKKKERAHGLDFQLIAFGNAGMDSNMIFSETSKRGRN